MKKKILWGILLFVIGVFNVNALEIPVNSYVIGEYLFTREGSDLYDGVLSTDYIMLASKSIDSKDLEDMIIYFKIGEDEFINGATGEIIDDVFLENDLVEQIKYYDMKKIPSVRISYDSIYGTSTSYPNEGPPIGYIIDYNVYDVDGENNLEVDVDFYGSTDETLNANEFYMITYPTDEDFEDLNLTLMERNTGGFSGNVGTRIEFDSAISNYTVFAYPYVTVVNKAGDSKKIYLEFTSDNIFSVRNDLMVERTFDNGKVKVSVVDNEGKKYKIMSAMLYKSFTTTDHNHLDAYDLANLYKQSDELKKYFDKNTVTVLDMVKEIYNNKYREIVDLYSITTTDTDKLLNTVELYDLGNSENIIGGTYLAYVQVCDEEGNIFNVASSNIMYNTSVTVNQLVIDDAYLNNESSSMDLFQTIVLMNALLSFVS